MTASNRNMRSSEWAMRALSEIDPLSDDLVTMSAGRHSRRCVAVRISRRIDTHENHFYFRSVYRIIDMPWLGYQMLHSYAAYESQYRTKINENLNRTSIQWGPMQNLGESNNRGHGNVFLVIEGGGPIDGSGIGVHEVRNLSQLHSNNYNGNIASTTTDHVRLSYGATCCFHKVVPSASGALRFEGAMMTYPYGTDGYVYGEVVSNSSQSPGHGCPSDGYEDESSLIEEVLRYRMASYPVYTGWIPKDLSDIVVRTRAFDLVKVGEKPASLFGSDLSDRLLNRRLHFRGTVSLLYGGVKYPVSTGEYFMIPKISAIVPQMLEPLVPGQDLKDMDMLQYDREVREIISEITLLSFSSRSLAITNRVSDRGDSSIVTSIKPRDLSGNTNGDSGFIPRPTRRKIN